MDIGLLLLQRSVILSSDVWPICLYHPAISVPLGTELIVAGKRMSPMLILVHLCTRLGDQISPGWVTSILTRLGHTNSQQVEWPILTRVGEDWDGSESVHTEVHQCHPSWSFSLWNRMERGAARKEPWFHWDKTSREPDVCRRCGQPLRRLLRRLWRSIDVQLGQQVVPGFAIKLMPFFLYFQFVLWFSVWCVSLLWCHLFVGVQVV